MTGFDDLIPHRLQRGDCETAKRDCARALGWAGVGIGLAEIAAPHVVAKLLGVPPSARTRGILGVLGVREIMQGVGIVGEDRPNDNLKAGMWARVAGDVLDAAVLSAAATQTRRPVRFALVATAVAGIAALDLLSAASLTDTPGNKTTLRSGHNGWGHQRGLMHKLHRVNGRKH